MSRMAIIRILTNDEYAREFLGQRRDCIVLPNGYKFQVYCYFPEKETGAWSRSQEFWKRHNLYLVSFPDHIAAQFIHLTA